jgi:hypothetical protein
MCQRVTCSSCGKPSYAGCGRHIESVLADVPPDKRCSCREQAKAAKAKPAEGKGGFLASLFGGRARSES